MSGVAAGSGALKRKASVFWSAVSLRWPSELAAAASAALTGPASAATGDSSIRKESRHEIDTLRLLGDDVWGTLFMTSPYEQVLSVRGQASAARGWDG